MFKKLLKTFVCGMIAVFMLAIGCGLSHADSNTVSSASDLRRGQIVRFGEWYGEPLGWYVIDIQGSKVMLMLAAAWMDNMPYNDVKAPVTWENCTLRQWLNGEFYDNAFSGNEKKRILEVVVPARANPKYSTNPGNETKDKVFLLSVQEFKNLLKVEKMRIFAKPHQSRGLDWWLRSPGDGSGSAALVCEDGSLYNFRVDLNFAVRPVLWINL